MKSDRDRSPIRLASGQGSSLRHKTARRPCPFAFELSGSDQWRLVIAGGQPALAFIVLYSVFKEHLVAESHLAHSFPRRSPQESRSEGVGTLWSHSTRSESDVAGGRFTTLRPGDLTVKGAARLATLAVPDGAPNPPSPIFPRISGGRRLDSGAARPQPTTSRWRDRLPFWSRT